MGYAGEAMNELHGTDVFTEDNRLSGIAPDLLAEMEAELPERTSQNSVTLGALGLNKLGAEILTINRANGFGEMTRADWDKPMSDEELATLWNFEEAHFVTFDHDQESWGKDSWRVFALRKDRIENGNNCISGMGASPEEALAVTKQRILQLPESKYRIPAVLALIHSEVSEALEEFRKEHRLDHFAEELADILIRTLDCAAALELDLDSAVQRKLEKNRQRGYKHGGRLI